MSAPEDDASTRAKALLQVCIQGRQRMVHPQPAGCARSPGSACSVGGGWAPYVHDYCSPCVVGDIIARAHMHWKLMTPARTCAPDAMLILGPHTCCGVIAILFWRVHIQKGQLAAAGFGIARRGDKCLVVVQPQVLPCKQFRCGRIAHGILSCQCNRLCAETSAGAKVYAS